MTLTKNQLKIAALKLKPAEREALAEELLLSINTAEREKIDAAWLAEARRRDADLVAGKASAKSLDQVIARLESKDRE